MRILLSGLLLLLVACTSSPEQVDNQLDNASLQPTIAPTLNVPQLGEAPPPPIPIALDDERYPVEAPTGDDLVEARTLYFAHCAECHGENGEGQQPDPYAPGMAPPHNETGHTWHHPDQQNFATVWQGRGNMPAFHDKLSPEEILLVLGYLKTWLGEDALLTQNTRTLSFIENPPPGS